MESPDLPNQNFCLVSGSKNGGSKMIFGLYNVNPEKGLYKTIEELAPDLEGDAALYYLECLTEAQIQKLQTYCRTMVASIPGADRLVLQVLWAEYQ